MRHRLTLGTNHPPVGICWQATMKRELAAIGSSRTTCRALNSHGIERHTLRRSFIGSGADLFGRHQGRCLTRWPAAILPTATLVASLWSTFTGERNIGHA